MRTAQQDQTPVLVGTIGPLLPEGFHVVTVWCEECRKYHRHGWFADDTRSHRAAHCVNPKSRYWNGGYYIEVSAG